MKSFDLQKESVEPELRNSNYDQKKFKFKFAWNKLLNFQNQVQVDYLDKGNKTKILALISLNLDKRAKSSEGLKIRD